MGALGAGAYGQARAATPKGANGYGNGYGAYGQPKASNSTTSNAYANGHASAGRYNGGGMAGTQGQRNTMTPTMKSGYANGYPSRQQTPNGGLQAPNAMPSRPSDEMNGMMDSTRMMNGAPPVGHGGTNNMPICPGNVVSVNSLGNSLLGDIGTQPVVQQERKRRRLWDP